MKETFIVPESINDIPLDKYQKLAKVQMDGADDEFIQRTILRIFYNVKPDTYEYMTNVDVGYLVNRVLAVLEEKPTFIPKFTHNKIEWGFEPNLNKLKYGSFVDLQSVEGDILKMMAILYRPIIKDKGDKYKIETYKGYSKYMDLLKDMPLSVAVGALSFFLNLWADLLKSTLVFLKVEMDSKAMSNKTLIKNGAGTQRFFQLQEEILKRYTGLHPLQSMKHLFI